MEISRWRGLGRLRVAHARGDAAHRDPRDCPLIIIEAKALRIPLDGEPLEQLEKYAKARPRMREGYAVLTDGNRWRIYDPPGRRRFVNMEPTEISVLTTSLDKSSRTLHEHLAKLKT